MKTYKTNSIRVAEKVLKELNKLPKVEAYLQMYENGREQGYTLKALYPSNLNISFSEARSSDQIVVWVWESDFEKAVAFHFGFGEYAKAAKFIHQQYDLIK